MKNKGLYLSSCITLAAACAAAVCPAFSQSFDSPSVSAFIASKAVTTYASKQNVLEDKDLYDGWYRSSDDGGWHYRNPDGQDLYGWQLIDDEWYYLMPDTGRMVFNCWVRDDAGIPCFLKVDGICVYGGLSWIGDSLSANWDPSHAIEEMFYRPHVAAKALKSVYEDYENNPSGLTIAKGMVMSGSMEKTLVFEVGSNSDWHTPDLTYADKIAMLRDIVGKDTYIILVTCYTVDEETTESYYGEINREMRSLAEQDPYIAVADWAAICDPETDLSPKDGLHHKDYEAACKYIRLIQDTLIDNFGPDNLMK